METKYKTIPFDVNRINEEGVKVVTRDGRNARVICTDYHSSGDKTLLALIDSGLYEHIVQLYENGRFERNKEDCYDLFMSVPYKYRRMTNKELSWWLRDCPEEHREWKRDFFKTGNLVYPIYEYYQNDANEKCDDDILIRRNGGAWEEPLIEN